MVEYWLHVCFEDGTWFHSPYETEKEAEEEVTWLNKLADEPEREQPKIDDWHITTLYRC